MAEGTLDSVLKGIAKYGPTKPFTSYAPFLVVWNITRACNLRCKHCYESAQLPGKDELNTEEALRAVDHLADARIAYIAISGGEPLIRPDLFEITKRMAERETAFSIATNATLMTREKARQLKEAKCLYVQVSLDGAVAGTHNSFRGRDAFEKTLEGIRNAVAEGPIVGLSMTVTKFNYDEVPAAVELGEKLGASIFMHYNFIPTGKGTGIADMDISPKNANNCCNGFPANPEKEK